MKSHRSRRSFLGAANYSAWANVLTPTQLWAYRCHPLLVGMSYGLRFSPIGVESEAGTEIRH
jgi:hypothetical protein